MPRCSTGALLFASTLLLCASAPAQSFDLPEGDSTVRTLAFGDNMVHTVVMTPGALYVSDLWFPISPWTLLWPTTTTDKLATLPDEFVDMALVGAGTSQSIAIVGRSGRVWSISTSGTLLSTLPPPDTSLMRAMRYVTHIAATGRTIVGYKLVLTWNDAQHAWQPDTAGARPMTNYWAIAVDHVGSEYMAGYPAGLVTRKAGETNWGVVASFRSNYNTSSVFVDRRDRILLSTTFSELWMSTDGGTTWALDTAGLADDGINFVNQRFFCDDASGDLYSSNGLAIWRSAGGEGRWSRIDAGASELFDEPIGYTGVSAGHELVGVTEVGPLVSADHRVWDRNVQGIRGGGFVDAARLPSGRVLLITTSGVYRRDAAGWTKVYPPSIYRHGHPLFVDGAGNAYTLGGIIDTLAGVSSSTRTPWMSSDDGTTWVTDSAHLDTAGAGQGLRIGQHPVFGVTPGGRRHYGCYGTPTLSVRAPGGVWQPDVNVDAPHGLTYCTVGEPYVFAFLGEEAWLGAYFSPTSCDSPAAIWHRSLAGVWSADTAGLGDIRVPLVDQTTPRFPEVIADNTTHALYAVGDGVFRKMPGQPWSRLPDPPGTAMLEANRIAVDSTGALVVGYQQCTYYGFTTGCLGRGVYRTTDLGQHWNSEGLDSVDITRLVALGGDTVMVLTTGHGIIPVTSQGALAVRESQPSAASRFTVFPMPARAGEDVPTLRVSLTEGDRAATLTLIDALGRTVARIDGVPRTPGEHDVGLVGLPPQSGVYRYVLRSAARVESGSVVVVR